MQVRGLTLMALGALIAAGAAAPAFADEDWHRHDRQEWREHEWREREWREHEWREHHRYYAPPPAYYGNPAYYR
jgi:hypothetical protein